MSVFLVWALALTTVGQAEQRQEKAIPIPDVVVSGEQARAIIVAERAFQGNPNIPAAKKDLRNYTLEIIEENSTIKVTFGHRQHPDEAGSMGGSGKLGVSVCFFIDRATWSVTRVLFLR